MNELNKKKIKKYITGLWEGQGIKEEELQKIRKALIDYSREDWKKLLTIIKDLLKEGSEKLVDKSNEIPSEWKNELKELSKAVINLGFAIANENFFYGCVQIEKQSNLTEEQKLLKGLSLLVPEVQKITTKFKRKVANYHKSEEKATKKYNTVLEIVRRGRKGEFNKDQEILMVSKILSIFKDINVDEIVVLKKKLKWFGMKLIEKFAGQSPMLAKLPELPGMAKTALDLVDAITDEKLIKDLLNIGVKIGEKMVEGGQSPNYSDLIKSLTEEGMEQDLKNLVVNFTAHLNKLASEGTSEENISSAESERILNETLGNISREGVNIDAPVLPPTPNNGSWWKTLGDEISTIVNSEEFQKELDKGLKELTKVQSKGKWYENPWKVGGAGLATVAAVGGITWLFFRRKNQKRYNNS